MGRFKSGGGRGSEGELCRNEQCTGTIKILFTNSILSCMRVILNNIEILEMGWLFRHLPYSVLLHISGPGPHTNFLSLLAKSQKALCYRRHKNE